MTTEQKLFFISGSLFAFLAVAAGAFGAHALRQKLSSEMLGIFEIGVRYQMYHALALVAIAWALSMSASAFIGWAGWAFILGIVIFSGSLYTLALTGVKAWGAVTPIGGVFFLIGWAFLAIGAFFTRS